VNSTPILNKIRTSYTKMRKIIEDDSNYSDSEDSIG